MEEQQEQLLQIDWSGPHSAADLAEMKSPTDRGLYQVYLHHPVYSECLAYIGKTERFNLRPSSHEYEKGSDCDRKRITYYVGRLLVSIQIEPEAWSRQINAAEKLLIHSHAPAYNSQHIDQVGSEKEVRLVRVLNWGDCRSLSREVSGRMWAMKKDASLKPYQRRV